MSGCACPEGVMHRGVRALGCVCPGLGLLGCAYWGACAGGGPVPPLSSLPACPRSAAAERSAERRPACGRGMSETGGGRGEAAAAPLPRRRAGGMGAAWGSVWCLCLAAAVGGLPSARRRGGGAAERSGGQPAGKGFASFGRWAEVGWGG